MDNDFDSFLNRKFFYKLENKTPVECNFADFIKSRESNDWVLKRSIPIKNIEVSTVFLGFNTSFPRKKPVCFETMIFGGKYNKKIIRYSDYDEAINDHDKWCLKLIDENI